MLGMCRFAHRKFVYALPAHFNCFLMPCVRKRKEVAGKHLLVHEVQGDASRHQSNLCITPCITGASVMRPGRRTLTRSSWHTPKGRGGRLGPHPA